MKRSKASVALISSTFLLSLFVAGPGCATRTRFGDLIPAHHLSDQREAEEVWVDISPGEALKDGAIPRNGDARVVLPVAALASAAVGAFIDYAKAQMQSEAARYDADFHGVAFSDTQTLFEKKKPIVLLTRWVKHTPPNTKEYNDVLASVQEIVTKATASSHSMDIKTADDFKNHIAGKSLAFAYCIELDRSNVKDLPSPPFLIKPQWKWQWLSKAKVVSLQTYNPLSWPAGLLLKTGSEVEYEVSFMLSALVMTTNGYPQTTTIGLKDPIQANGKFDLSGTKHLADYKANSPPTAGWVVVPGYPTLKDYGYFGIGIAVKESDPSNVKTMLLQGSKYLQDNKQSIVNRVVGSQ